MFRGTHWIRSWAILSKKEGRIILKEGCRWVEIVALEISHKSGWNAFKAYWHLVCDVWVLMSTLCSELS
jgi:hypothetical protein